jgi:hypothetical protein
VTESDWLNATDPQAMLIFLRDSGRASDRKLRLFAVACCRDIWRWVSHPGSRLAVETSERYADGAATPAELRKAERKASAATSELSSSADLMMRLSKWAEKDAAQAAAEVARKPLSPGLVAAKARAAFTATPVRPKDQSATLRDIFGNPFRPPPAIDPAWLTPPVVSVARRAYDERDFAALPVLADALEEAGCDSADLLRHCRERGLAHCRGCWAVDLILGRS